MLTSAVREADELAVFEGERGAVLEALELAVEERLGKADLDGVELPRAHSASAATSLLPSTMRFALRKHSPASRTQTATRHETR